MTYQNENIIVLENYRIENKKYNKNFLYILIGLPASGKTFYARQNLAHENTVIVSTDELRKEVYGSYAFSQKSNDTIINIALKRIDFSLQGHHNVVFDATNTNKKNRASIISIGKKYNSKIIGIVFLTPLETCISRNRLRPDDRRVPDDKLRLMAAFNPYINPSEEGFHQVIYIKGD